MILYCLTFGRETLMNGSQIISNSTILLRAITTWLKLSFKLSLLQFTYFLNLR